MASKQPQIPGLASDSRFLAQTTHVTMFVCTDSGDLFRRYLNCHLFILSRSGLGLQVEALEADSLTVAVAAPIGIAALGDVVELAEINFRGRGGGGRRNWRGGARERSGGGG